MAHLPPDFSTLSELTAPQVKHNDLFTFSPADLLSEAAIDLLASARGKKFGTILTDPPWQFQNRTGKVAPEHKRPSRHGTIKLEEMRALLVADIAA
jgi:hypothetical protein